jgi:dGTPase
VLDRWPAIEPNRQAHEVQRRVITRMIEDVIRTSAARIEAAGIRSADDARNAGQALIRFSDEAAIAERGLKRFLYERVYRSEAVMVPVREGETVIAELFDGYMADPDLPGRWAGRVNAAPSAAERARVICDFIAGMTDPYALEQHARLFDGSPALR